jgi:hypothetical protein
MNYRFQDHFDAAPLGPLTTANKKLAWPDSAIYSMDTDPDPSGEHFSIIEDSRFANGRAQRMCYPQGQYGMNHQFYILRLKSPKVTANLEFDWLFEDGFDLWPPNPDKLGGGKIAPCINWGEVGGVTEKRGTRAMMWYNGNGSHYQKGVFSPSCQDQRTGNQLIQPVQYGPVIQTETVYHIRIRIHGGDNGLAEYWIDDGFHAQSVAGSHLQVGPDDDVLYDFAFFAGGGAVQACRWDSFARVGNIHAWDGEGEWQQEPQPGPAQTYRLEGTFTGTITPLPGS